MPSRSESLLSLLIQGLGYIQTLNITPKLPAKHCIRQSKLLTKQPQVCLKPASQVCLSCVLVSGWEMKADAKMMTNLLSGYTCLFIVLAPVGDSSHLVTA